MSDIATKIKKMREEANLSASQLAEKADLTPAYISKLENGKYTSLSLTSCKALADAFGLNLKDFLEKLGYLQNKQRPSLELITQALRGSGYSPEQVARIVEYAKFIKKSSN